MSSALLLVITSMISVLVISEVGSFNRALKTKTAYALAKEGVQIAVANINNGKTQAEVNALQGKTSESGQYDIYQVTSWNQNSRVLTVQGRAQVRNETNCRLDVNGDGRDEFFVCKNISTKLIEDPDTFKYEESFSGVADRLKPPTTAEWSGDGQVYLTSTTTPARTTGDMFATYTNDTLPKPNPNEIDVIDASGFTGNPDPDEVLIANTQSGSDGTQETARIESVDYDNDTITLADPVQNTYAPPTSITRIPQYTSVTIEAGATATINSWNAVTTTGGIMFFRANDPTDGVQIDGAIDISRRGYSKRRGPGRGGGYGGAGYGARGGHGRGGGSYADGGVAYGSNSTAEYMGSGGGGNNGNGDREDRGRGGGHAKIVARTIAVPGSVQSNGGGGIGIYIGAEGYRTGAGGSGGGISIEGNTVNLSGAVISAAGGGGAGLGLAQNGLDGFGGRGIAGGTFCPGGYGNGAGPTANPGRGGNGCRNFWNDKISAEDGFAGSGGGGGGSWDVQSGSGGGAAGRIAIRYGSLTGGNPSGYTAAPSGVTTGPWAFYTNAAPTDFGDGSDGALVIDEDTNLSDTSSDTTGSTVYNSDLIVQSNSISGSADNIRKATIYVYPSDANSSGNLTSLSMSTRTVDDVFIGGIEGTNGFDVSSGNGPYVRAFTWANDSLGNELQYSFKLTTADNTQTPRIEHIKIVYITGPNFKIDYSTWRAD